MPSRLRSVLVSSRQQVSGRHPCGAILEKWRTRLVTTHLSDNNGEYDDHALPWDGNVDWEAVADCFPSETYSGPIMLEVYPQNGDRRTPEEFLRTAHERAVRLREKLG